MWYLAAVLGCWVFYMAYGEWFSCLALLIVLWLPWLSLVLSLPAMLRFRLEPGGPDAVTMGDDAELWLLGSCPLPMPPFRGKLTLRRCATGQTERFRRECGLSTAHCGGITVTIARPRVCDYLGLFAFPVRHVGSKTILIRPTPLPVRNLPGVENWVTRAWKPKNGGFAENHELRLYRPGDSLNQVHWKLSAKTGKRIVRQPMEPQRDLVLLTMTLRGSPEELDRKFGRLVWLGQYLLERDIFFEIRALTAQGVLSAPVSCSRELENAVDTLLRSEAAREGSIRDKEYAAAWRCHIGGEPDET